MSKHLIAISFIILGWMPQAYAYIDPVTGSVIIQSIVAAVAVVLVAMRRLRERIAGLFRKKTENEDDQRDSAQP